MADEQRIRHHLKRILLGLAAVVSVGGATAFIVRGSVERRYNSVRPGPGRNVSEKARHVHQTLTIVDLHADSLLWGRNLLKRSRRGHVDIPRLIEGNVALQAFTVVTGFAREPSRSGAHPRDDIRLLAMGSGWPARTWGSFKERALYQAERLRKLEAASGGGFRIVRSKRDLARLLEQRRADSSISAGFLGLEGAHALEGDLENLDLFFAAGFRMISPTHFADTDMGGSSAGSGGGLTPKGRELIRRMEARGILVDVAHASPKTIQDVLEIAKGSVVASHTGVRGTCDRPRNLADREIRGIAKSGGVVGVGYWPKAVCGSEVRAIVRAIRHAVGVAGVEHVALGSDFDGATTTPFDAAGLAQLTQGLMDGGFEEGEIRKIMGENTLRVLGKTLPD